MSFITGTPPLATIVAPLALTVSQATYILYCSEEPQLFKSIHVALYILCWVDQPFRFHMYLVQ